MYMFYTTNNTFYMYCGLMLIRGDQCLWIVKILLVLARGDVISWVIGLLHYNYTGQFITLLNVRRDVNSLVRVTPEINLIKIRSSILSSFFIFFFLSLRQEKKKMKKEERIEDLILIRLPPEILEHRSPTNTKGRTVCMKKFTKCLQLYTVRSLISLTFSILYLDIFLKIFHRSIHSLCPCNMTNFIGEN